MSEKINYYDFFIGRDFDILSENITRDNFYASIINCGFETPLELFSEESLNCYDDMINEEIPFELRPMTSKVKMLKFAQKII